LIQAAFAWHFGNLDIPSIFLITVMTHAQLLGIYAVSLFLVVADAAIDKNNPDVSAMSLLQQGSVSSKVAEDAEPWLDESLSLLDMAEDHAAAKESYMEAKVEDETQQSRRRRRRRRRRRSSSPTSARRRRRRRRSSSPTPAPPPNPSPTPAPAPAFNPNGQLSDQISKSSDIALPGGVFRGMSRSNGPDMNQNGPEPMYIHSDPQHQATAMAWADSSQKCRVGVLNSDDSGFAWTKQLAGKCKGLHVRDDGVVAVLEASGSDDPTLMLILFDKSGKEKGRTNVQCLSNKDGRSPHSKWKCTMSVGGILRYSKKQNLYGVYWGGGCRSNQWCKGHQGGCQTYVDAATMKLLPKEGNSWVCSHDMHQAFGVNAATGAFAGACGGDAYPKGIKISVKAARGQFSAKTTITTHWGNMGGKMAARFGQIVGDGNGFLIAWSSFGTATSGAHELMVSRLSTSGGNLAGFPKKLTVDGKDKQDVTVVPFPTGYLVGYIENVYPPTSRLLKLDAQANKVGVPEAIPSANLQKIAGGLTVRAGGEIVWITEITGQSFRLARVGGGVVRPSPSPSPSPPLPDGGSPSPVPRPSPSSGGYKRLTGQYLAGYVGGDGARRNKDQSRVRCDQIGYECGGFTCNRDESKRTTRASRSPSFSPSGEITYVKLGR